MTDSMWLWRTVLENQVILMETVRINQFGISQETTALKEKLAFQIEMTKSLLKGLSA